MLDTLKTLGSRFLSRRPRAATPQLLRTCEVEGWLEPADSPLWRGLVLEVYGPNTGETVSQVAGTLPYTAQLTALWRNRPAAALKQPVGLPEYISAAPRATAREVRLFLFLKVPETEWSTGLALSWTRKSETGASVRVVGLEEAVGLLREHESLWSDLPEPCDTPENGPSAGCNVARPLAKQAPKVTQLYSLEATRRAYQAPWKTSQLLSIPQIFGPAGLLLKPHEEAWVSLTLSPNTGLQGGWRTYWTVALRSEVDTRLENRVNLALWSARWAQLNRLTPATALAWGRAPLRSWCSQKAPLKAARLWGEPVRLNDICDTFSTPAGFPAPSSGGESGGLSGLVLLDSMGQRHLLNSSRLAYNPSVLITGGVGSGLTFHSNLLALSNWLDGQHVFRISWEPLQPLLRDVTGALEVPHDLAGTRGVNPFWGFSSLDELEVHLDLLCSWLVNFAHRGWAHLAGSAGAGVPSFGSTEYRECLRSAVVRAWGKRQAELGLQAILDELQPWAPTGGGAGAEAVVLAPYWFSEVLDALTAAQQRVGAQCLEGPPYLQADLLVACGRDGRAPAFWSWFPGLDDITDGWAIQATAIRYASLLDKVFAQGGQGAELLRRGATLVIDELSIFGRDEAGLLPSMIRHLNKRNSCLVCTTSSLSSGGGRSQAEMLPQFGSVLFLQTQVEQVVRFVAPHFGDRVAAQAATLRSSWQGSSLLWVQNEHSQLLRSEWSPALTALLGTRWEVAHAYEAALRDGAGVERAVGVAAAVLALSR